MWKNLDQFLGQSIHFYRFWSMVLGMLLRNPEWQFLLFVSHLQLQSVALGKKNRGAGLSTAPLRKGGLGTGKEKEEVQKIPRHQADYFFALWSHLWAPRKKLSWCSLHFSAAITRCLSLSFRNNRKKICRKIFSSRENLFTSLAPPISKLA